CQTGVVTEDVVVADGGGDGDWLLTVNLGAAGGGTVRGDVDNDGTPEINCPADCTERVADQTIVYLLPTANAGLVFDHWEGLGVDPLDSDYGPEGCLVHMVEDRTITAVFVASH